MEKNAIIAFVLSMAVFGAYFLFFSPKEPPKPPKDQVTQVVPARKESPTVPAATEKETPTPPAMKTDAPKQSGRDIVVKNKQFEAVFSEEGAVLKSLKLSAYKENLGGKDPKEMIQSDQSATFPLQLE